MNLIIEFSSPIGDFVIYTAMNLIIEKGYLFSSPIGDFVIYTKINMKEVIKTSSFRPLSGILLFIQQFQNTLITGEICFRPLSGILLFIPYPLVTL